MLCIRPNKNEKMVRDQKFLKTLLGKLDRGEIRRDFWLQRKSTQWNNQIRDQAIVTTVQGEDIDPVKICEEIREGKPSQKWIVDGGNRFETWNNFYNNVFALGKNLENYIVPYESTKKDENGNVVKDEDGYPIMEELEFDLRGKRYKDLPMELKERFNNYKVIYVEHSNCTESRMGYHIRRYNNQKSMNKNQKSVTYMEQTAKWTKEIMNSNPFFKELPCYHGASEKNSDPERVMLDTVMIIFFKDEWKSNAEKNALYVETNGEKEQFNLLDNYLGRMYALVEDNDELSKLFEKKDAPMWIALFDKFSKLEMDDSKFKEFLEAFIGGLRETKINGESFDEIKGNKSTKNRNTINYEDSTVENIIPERHVFMGNTYFYGKIVSLLGSNITKGKNGMNNIFKYMMLSQMMNGNGSTGTANNINSMLPFMMMGGNMGDMFDGMFDFDEVDDTNEFNEVDTEEEE